MKKLFLFSLAAVVAAGTCVLAQRGGERRGSPHQSWPNAQYYTPQPRTVPSLPAGCVAITVGGADYYYGAGMYYRAGSSGYLVVPAPVGAVVTTLPSGAQQVLVGDTLCYLINGVAYRKTVYGYEVMPPPAVVVQQVVTAVPPVSVVAPEAPPPVTNATFTVNIPKAKGGFTPVEIRRSGTNFLGPQGELYTEFPRVEQLKLMYGK
jgi:hypothetical protein